MRTKSLLAVVLVTVATFSLACSKSNDAPVVSAQSGNNSSSTTAASSSDKTSTTKSGDSSGNNSSSGDNGNVPTGLGSCYDASIAWITLTGEVMTLQSPTATQEERDKAKADADAFRNKVPDEIKGDVDTWLNGWNNYMKAISGISDNKGGIPSPGDLQKIEEASKALDDPAFKKASDNISAYFDTHCKDK